MNAEFFLDTNILVYAFFKQDEGKMARNREIHELALDDGRGVISFQVVQEFLNAAIRKFPKQFSGDELNDFLEASLWPLCAVFPSRELYAPALQVQSETRFSFYDSLMVVAAAEAGCKIIYSEDLQHKRRLRGLEIINPFL